MPRHEARSPSWVALIAACGRGALAPCHHVRRTVRAPEATREPRHGLPVSVGAKASFSAGRGSPRRPPPERRRPVPCDAASAARPRSPRRGRGGGRPPVPARGRHGSLVDHRGHLPRLPVRMDTHVDPVGHNHGRRHDELQDLEAGVGLPLVLVQKGAAAQVDAPGALPVVRVSRTPLSSEISLLGANLEGNRGFPAALSWASRRNFPIPLDSWPH
jgi:hypothetical protein